MKSVKSIVKLVASHSDNVEDATAVMVAFQIAAYVARSVETVPQLSSLVEQLEFLYGNRAMVRLDQLIEDEK